MEFRGVASYVIIIFNLVVFFYFAAINTVYLVLFAAAFVNAIKYNRHRRFVDLFEVFRSPLTPSISVLVPAFNEEASIVESVRSILLLRYPRFEVVVVNDGSEDRTLELLIERYNLKRVSKLVEQKVPCEEIRGVYISPDYNNLVVVDKENGGKADALNAGVNVSRHDLICMIDADSLIEPEGLLKVARPFIENPDTTVGVGGLVRLVNGCTVEGGSVTRVRLPRSYLANLQTVEYLRAFLGGRIGWSALRSLLIISGAFGLFNRDVVVEIGGYRQETVGEDMDLVVRMHRHLRREKRKYRIFFVPDPVCWTEAPERYRDLARQRDRWQRGLMETLIANDTMLCNPRYGSIGLVAMPYFFFFEMMGPVIELSGYVVVVLALLLGFLNVQFFYLFLSLAVLYSIAVSLFAVLLQGVTFRHYSRVPALLKLGFYSIMENVGYRQVNAWWRTKAFVTVFTRRQSWGAISRKGYGEEMAGDVRRRRPVAIAVMAGFLVALAVAALVGILLVRGPALAPAPPMADVEGTSMAARAVGRYFEVYDGKGWRKTVVKGVNVGTALPGKWFSEFPEDPDLYREWFEQIAAMDVNTIRVYTLLDPVFYQTLDEFNRSSGTKLMLLQEIWPDDEVPDDNLYGGDYTEEYHKEIALNMKALRGEVEIPERRGRAWGMYDTDVSPYVLGVLVGRELLYEEVLATNSLNPGLRSHDGRFVATAGEVSPSETWLAETCDFAAERMQAGGWQAPVGFVSWPTLDPMTHPTEATPGVPREEEHEDSQVVDPNHILAGPDKKAGLFGCYHIYPYYPDFMNREPSYAEYADDEGVLRYGGYLRQFMALHPDYPALVGEFGISTSMGIAHLHPEGFHHGGVDEKMQGEQVARMYRAILNEGYAGGVVFEWADEWAKRTWVDMDFMIPFERHIFWHNMMDPEQNFGILAYDAERTAFEDGGTTLLDTGHSRTGRPRESAITRIRADYDASFTYLEIKLAGPFGNRLKPGAEGDYDLAVGLDTFGADNGTTGMPYTGLPPLPTGVEFLLRLNAREGGLLLARPDYDRGKTKFIAAPATDSEFVRILLPVNRLQFSTEDGTIFPVEYTDDSALSYGDFDPRSPEFYSLANWHVSDDGTTVTVRLPWLLLNVSDPSSRTVLYDTRTDLPEGPAAVRTQLGTDAIGTTRTAGFGFYAVTGSGGAVEDFQPRRGDRWQSAKQFKWPVWEGAPPYVERLKQSYRAITEM